MSIRRRSVLRHGHDVLTTFYVASLFRPSSPFSVDTLPQCVNPMVVAMTKSRNLLACLVAADDRSQAEIVVAWNDLAVQMGETATLSSRQFDRWLAGQLTGLPHKAACRVSERLWSRRAVELFGPAPTTVIVDNRTALPEPLEKLIMSSAHESSDHAAGVARYVDDTSIETLQESVVRAARSYAGLEPLQAYGDLLKLRGRAYMLLDRTGRPSQEQDLYLAISQICSLLAGAAFDLGVPQAAAEHARAAHTYGRLIGHNAAQAFANAIQATLALWSGQPSRGVQFTKDGLDLVRTGPAAVRLHAVAARCWALQADEDAVVKHLRQAEAARDGDGDGMCDEVRGEFDFSPARSAFSAGSAYLALGDGHRAAAEAGRALGLYEQAPSAERYYGALFGARADLVAAHVLTEQLEEAETTMQPMLELPVAHRTEGVVRRLRRLGHGLGHNRYATSPVARRVAGHIEEFMAEVPPRALPPGMG